MLALKHSLIYWGCISSDSGMFTATRNVKRQVKDYLFPAPVEGTWPCQCFDFGPGTDFGLLPSRMKQNKARL